jgi:hypothetical protein
MNIIMGYQPFSLSVSLNFIQSHLDHFPRTYLSLNQEDFHCNLHTSNMDLGFHDYHQYHIKTNNNNHEHHV